MSQYQYANNPATTLSGSVTAGATSISVASSADFPTHGKFTIIVDSEIMLVTGVAGTTWTVERGAEDTAAASHTNNTPVAGILTKGSFLNAHHFDVRHYGATGNGTTDDTTALQDALDAASDAGGGVVFLPPGTYRTTAPITLANSVVLRGSGKLTVIKVDHANEGIKAVGSLGTLYTLASNASSGDGTITLSAGNGSHFSALDEIWIQSEAAAVGAGHKKAELQIVSSVSTDTLSFAGVIADSYATADTAKAGVVTPVTHCGIELLSIYNTTYDASTTTSSAGLIVFDFTHGAFVRNCFLNKNNGKGIDLRNTLDTVVQGNHIEQLRDDAANSIYGYGVEIAFASQGTVVDGNNFRRCRHAVTTGTSNSGLTPNYGISRAIAITGNTVADCTNTGIDTHEDSDGVAITGNSVLNCREMGIQARCTRVNVSGNTVRGIRGIGIYSDVSASDVLIANNLVAQTNLSPSSTNGYGIWGGASRESIIGNYVSDSAAHGIYVSAGTGQTNISNNVCMNNGKAATGDGIQVDANRSRLVIVGNTCSDDQASKTQLYGIRLTANLTNGGDNVLIHSNMLINNSTGPFTNAGTGSPHAWGNSPGSAPGYTQRVKVTTGSVGAAATADVTVAWPLTFSDANYVVEATCEGTNGQLTVRGIYGVGASSCVVRVENKGGAAITGTLHVVGVHL